MDDAADFQPAGTTLEDVATYTIDGGTLTTNKMAIEIIAGVKCEVNASRKRHVISFNGTNICDFFTGDNLVNSAPGATMRARIVRESNTVVRCYSDIVTDGPLNGTPRTYYTRITSLNLTTTGYNIVFSIRNYTAASDSTLIDHAAYLRPCP